MQRLKLVSSIHKLSRLNNSIKLTKASQKFFSSPSNKPESNDNLSSSLQKDVSSQLNNIKETVSEVPKTIATVLCNLNNQNNIKPAFQFALADNNSSRYTYGINTDAILYSKGTKESVEGSGDINRAGVRSGVDQPNPTGTSQKPEKVDQVFNKEGGSTVEQRKQAVPPNRKRFRDSQVNSVPSSAFSRAFEFAGLGFKLASSALGGKVKGAFGSEKGSVKDSIMTEANADMITRTLCRMRGIPLKLAQTLSIQEDNLIPKTFKDALEQAQRAADIMPDNQVDQMLKQELGENWRDRFQEFENKPIAAASIGQVHKATMKNGTKVAVKIQYPGVAESIDSDIGNLKRLISFLNLLPRTMYVDQLLANMRTELQEECDYIKEGEKQMDMKNLLKKKRNFFVPAVIPEASSKKVLTSEWVDGIGLDECDGVLTQEEKDRLGYRIFHLVLTQLFELRYLQTDPNPANYFYNPDLDMLSVIDYGAARKFSKEFVSNYLDVIYGAVTKNPDLVLSSSVKLGFLTGEESREMKEAHVGAVMIVGEPFAHKGPFDFGNHDITARIYEKIPVMVKNRLKPPPQEVYSLHRVLSGTFLACMKLKARVNVGKIFKEVYTNALTELKS